MRETRAYHSMKYLNIFLTVFLLLLVAFVIFAMLPRHVKYSNREAPASMYYDAKKVFDETHRQKIDDNPEHDIVRTYRGDCPDLSIMTAKALADNVLTLGEVYDLGVEANRLNDESNLIESKNKALEAAGLPTKPNPINCPSGSSLFSMYDR